MALDVAGPSALWSGFTAKAELLGAAVMRTASEATAVGLLRETANQFTCTASAARRFPRIAEHATATAVDQPAREVVAAGEFAVAETGSVAVNEARADRGLCFLAERLWLLVPEAEIALNLDTAMLRMRDLVQAGAPHPLFMSGPSRTADIERVLTVGVHGPRALVIVVIGQAA
jgi:L-lactate dehydrogenase complex protein LldG